MRKIDTDMTFQILTWISVSSFYQIHYFHKKRLLFSTYDIPTNTAFARENPFYSDSELFAKLHPSMNSSECEEQITTLSLQAETDNQYIYYGILKVSSEDVCIIGPASVEKLTPLHLREYMRCHH